MNWGEVLRAFRRGGGSVSSFPDRDLTPILLAFTGLLLQSIESATRPIYNYRAEQYWDALLMPRSAETQ